MIVWLGYWDISRNLYDDEHTRAVEYRNYRG